MDEMKIPFICGRVAWNHKPHKTGDEGITPQQAMEIVECQKPQHYKTVAATPQQIYKLICEGRCWRAGIFKDGAKDLQKHSFVGARIIALDFDKCETSPQEMTDYCKYKGLEPNFWYYSFSQGLKELYNYRIVWLLDEAITVEDYEKLYVALLNDVVFKAADPQCKNISRLWFGTRNGGEFLKGETIPFSKFDVFPRVVEKKRGGKGKASGKTGSSKAEGLEQVTTAETFIMPRFGFPWEYYLSGVCDLWDKWRKKQYLKNPQRLLLFSELKCLKYDKTVKRSILDEIMRYYDEALYAGSKCNREQIQYFLSDKTKTQPNKIVSYDGKEYTIAEWFNSGDYIKRDKAEREKRITREELKQEADSKIPMMLEEDGIQYIECQTEAGKTERILNYFASIDLTQVKIIYSIPTYILIDEFINRLRKKGVAKEVIFCPRKVEYTPEEQIYLDMGFPECVPLNDDMVARRKELEKVEDTDKKGLFILTHSALTHLKKITASKIIIDENIEDCLVKRYSISLSALGALKTFIYTKDEVLKEEPRSIVLEGETTEDKIEYLEKQIAAVNDDLQLIIDTVRNAEPQTKIEGIDTLRLINYINAHKLSKDDGVKDSLKHIGQLRNATLLSVGENTYKSTRYLYFEIASQLIPKASAGGISVKLLTGTPKQKQLETGLPEEMKGKIEQLKIDRADPLGNIYQWLIEGASGSKSSMAKTLDYAIEQLEKRGVDWTAINLLTLKSCRDMARERGFLIPQTENGEDIYIENCAGIDDMKGKDLIVIGKADIPKNSYLDMLHEIDVDDTQKKDTKPIYDTGIEAFIYGFLDRDLWDLQAEQIREPIEQAVGRARTLWYDCNVYVFCDYPVRNATEYIRGAR